MQACVLVTCYAFACMFCLYRRNVYMHICSSARVGRWHVLWYNITSNRTRHPTSTCAWANIHTICMFAFMCVYQLCKHCAARAYATRNRDKASRRPARRQVSEQTRMTIASARAVLLFFACVARSCPARVLHGTCVKCVYYSYSRTRYGHGIVHERDSMLKRIACIACSRQSYAYRWLTGLDSCRRDQQQHHHHPSLFIVRHHQLTPSWFSHSPVLISKPFPHQHRTYLFLQIIKLRIHSIGNPRCVRLHLRANTDKILWVFVMLLRVHVCASINRHENRTNNSSTPVQFAPNYSLQK